MSIPIQTDLNGDPYLFVPGDMGEYRERPIGRYKNARTGEQLVGRFCGGQQKFTGGTSSDGSPTLANNHPPIAAEDIPLGVPWPTSQLGPDPR